MFDAIKKYKYNYLILLILPFFVFMIGPNVILKMGVHSDYTIWTGDALAQMMPYVTYFRDQGFDLSAFIYNPNYGVGNEMFGTFFYYMSSPILWLIFLFPKSWLFNVVWVLVILRYGIGGIAFHTWLHRHYPKINNKVLLLLSLGFIFSGYFIFSFAFYQWLDFLFIIPLMMIGLDRIIEGRSIWLFASSMIYMIISNFYIAYMLVLFSLFYLVYMLSVNGQWTKKLVKQVTVKYVLSGMVSFIVTLPVLYVVVTSMMNSRLSTTIDTNTIGLFDQNLSIIRLIGKLQLGSHSYQEVYDGHPIIWMSIGLFMIYILSFFHKDLSSRTKKINLLFLVSLIVLSSTHVSYVLIHAGSLPNGLPYRHSFFFNLLIFFMLAEFFNSVESNRLFVYKNAYVISKSKLLSIMTILGVVLGICYFLSHTAYPVFSIISIVLYFIYLLFLLVIPRFSVIDTLVILEYVFGSFCVLVFFFLAFGYSDANYAANVQKGIAASNAPVDDNYRYSIVNRVTTADNSLLPFIEYGSIALFASNKPVTDSGKLAVLLGGDAVSYSGDTSQNYISDALLGRKYIIDTNVDTSHVLKQFIDTSYRKDDLNMDMLRKEGMVYVNNYVLSRFYLTDSDFVVNPVADLGLVSDQAKMLDSIIGRNVLTKLDLPIKVIVKKDGVVMDQEYTDNLVLNLDQAKYEIEVIIDSDKDYDIVYADAIYKETDIHSDRVKYNLNSFAIARSLDVNGFTVKKSRPSEFSLKKGENKMVFEVNIKNTFDVSRLQDQLEVFIDLSQLYSFNAEAYKTALSAYNDEFKVNTEILHDGFDVYRLTVDKTNTEKYYIDSSVIYDSNFVVSDGYNLVDNEGFLRIEKTNGQAFSVGDSIKLSYKLPYLSLILIFWFCCLNLILICLFLNRNKNR